MKAITFDRYGTPDPLRLQNGEKPDPPGDQVLVRVRAAGASPDDWHFLTGKPNVLRLIIAAPSTPRCKRLGVNLAGDVEAVGRGATRFQVGDPVFGLVDDVPGKDLLINATRAATS